MSTRREPRDPLAAAVVAALRCDADAVAVLRALLIEHESPATEPAPPAYTVASLAAALCVSAKVVRGAISRGELAAVKRGGRWLIPADAVDAWTQPQRAPRRFARGLRQQRDGTLAEVFQRLERHEDAA